MTTQIPETHTMALRPVFERLLERKQADDELPPPTEAEKRDAIRVLKENWRDDPCCTWPRTAHALYEEAERILDEAGRLEVV